ncbi:hypothetical protein [Anaerovorax sp. IOR16]|uniref:hypothetical protein n=1 Tax=Anaerovorax sp. IOR16 TaxID=2773458 RepID=UPI0019D18266|nr:hypothetical protein [Anaerovorax sp. IOR16]
MKVLRSVLCEVSSSNKKNIFILGKIRKKILEDIELYDDMKDDFSPRMQERFDLLKSDIVCVEKMIRKANGYKNICIDYDGDYDETIMRIVFPKGTTKKFKYNWLLNNDLPLYSEHYPTNSMYDCTGQCFARYVKMKGNVYTVSSHYDL